jgi:MFS transporter, DHA1 family, tetracycline resistance protein
MLTKRRAALGFIFVTALLDMLAFGIAAPTLPKLISDFLGGNTARASEYLGFFITTFALVQFFFSPVLGLISDRFGRRPVILLSNFGLAVDYAIMALAPSLNWLFLGRALAGLSASSIPTAAAYISDVTEPEKRSKGFGLLGAAFGVGFVIGPAIGGWLGQHDPRLPFWVAAAASLLNACYGFFVLPESLAPEKRQPHFQWKKANPLGSLKLLRRHTELLGLATVNFLGDVAHEVYLTVWILYVIYRFDWDQRMVGMGLAVVGIFSIVCSAALVGPSVAKFGERRALLAGLLCGALGFAMYGWASSATMFFAAIAVNSLWSLARPTSQALMTRRVSASEQGELQGAIASIRGIGMIIGPQIFAVTFAYFIAPEHKMPGAPWYLAALLLVASFAIALAVAKDTKRDLGNHEDKDDGSGKDTISGGLANVEVEIG